MYEEPTLERYGTFRELTQGGGDVPSDGFTTLDTTDGCVPIEGTNDGVCFGS